MRLQSRRGKADFHTRMKSVRSITVQLALIALAIGLPVIAKAQTNTWVATGSMTTARSADTATLLTNGMVLVAAGQNVSGDATNSAELYNPTNGIWTATGSLHTARDLHTATLLPNGMVLVAGGDGSSGNATNSAELYNPTNGMWTATGSLHTVRDLHTATLLTNGQVLVAGGVTNGLNSTNSAELYNPTNGMWTATGSMNTVRSSYTATLLPNGMVLVAGGETNGLNSTNSAELYNPATGIWTATGSMKTGRFAHTATLLPNGMVLVAGGATNNFNSGILSSAELYDLAGGTWTSTGSMTTPRDRPTATLLPNGKVLAAGGYNGTTLSSAELYTPSSAPPPLTFQITSIVRTNHNDLFITWNTTGTSNIVQVSSGTGGSYSNSSFADLTNIVVTTTTTNFWNVGALTNGPARYYRIWAL